MKGEKDAYFCLNWFEALAIRTIFHFCLTRMEKTKKVFDSISLPCPHNRIFPINVNEDYKDVSGGNYVSKQINCHLTGYKFQNIGDSPSISYPACNPEYSHLFTERNRKLLAGTNPSPLGLELDYLFSFTASESLSDSVTEEEF